MNVTPRARRHFSWTAGPAMNLLRADDLRVVKARRKPSDEWRNYSTRTLDRVTGFQPLAEVPKTDPYGGRLDRKQRAIGFFYLAKLNRSSMYAAFGDKEPGQQGQAGYLVCECGDDVPIDHKPAEGGWKAASSCAMVAKSGPNSRRSPVLKRGGAGRSSVRV